MHVNRYVLGKNWQIVLVKKVHEYASGDITQMVCVCCTAATTRLASVSTANTAKHFQYTTISGVKLLLCNC